MGTDLSLLEECILMIVSKDKEGVDCPCLFDYVSYCYEKEAGEKLSLDQYGAALSNLQQKGRDGHFVAKKQVDNRARYYSLEGSAVKEAA